MASTQKCHSLLMKKANTVMRQYTPMPTPTMNRAPNLSASLMYSRQKGRPSTCTSSSASSILVASSPRVSP